MEEPKPYHFGHAGTQQSPAMLNAIDRLGERLARRIRILVEPFSGGRPVVKVKPIEETMFMMWDACVPQFASLSLYRLHPISGVCALRIDAGLVSSLVDRFYGGRGVSTTAEMTEFTPTETRIIDKLSNQIMAALVDCASDVVHMDALLVGRETGVARAEICSSDSDVVIQSFEVNIGEHASWTIEILYPLSGLQAVEIASDAKAGQDSRPYDPIWHAKLNSRMEDVRLPARTVLARPNLKMSELMSLKPGDVINIHVARHLPLIIGNRVFAHGTIGEQDGRAAFMIEKLA